MFSTKLDIPVGGDPLSSAMMLPFNASQNGGGAA
jgi:hypothetical protein